MIKYIFKDGPLRIKGEKDADPQKIGESLMAIKAANDGRLLPEFAWQAAQKDKKHPLHDYFEWDVQKAAEAHWTDQARHLISLIKVDDGVSETPPRAFLSVSDGVNRTSYHSLKEVVDSASLQSSVLRSAERDIIAFEKRYREILDICHLVHEIRERLARKRA